MSVNALMIIVVDDIDSIPPRKRQSIKLIPRKCPTAIPLSIMPVIIIITVDIALPPTFISLRKLNSTPSENSNMTIPICAQNSMLAAVVTEGRGSKLGLAKKPATIYPSTTGCLIHLNTSVTTAPSKSINARSDIRPFISISIGAPETALSNIFNGNM